MKKILLPLLLMQALTDVGAVFASEFGMTIMHPVYFSLNELDSNRDGNISLQEYLAADASNTEMIYRHMDQNGDGMLDAEEQAAIEAVYQGIQEQQQVKNNSI